MPTFAHPAALWALLGIPIVLAIHFLQKRSRRVTATTLFLLQQMRRESEKGNRIEKLRLSIPLWLQLLMVLLFTWLLASPQWLKKDAVLRVAIILDSSASMSAFRQNATEALTQTLSTLVQPGVRTELTLLESDANAASLYYGNSSAELVASATTWQPSLGTHDFTPVLRRARSLVGAQGGVLLITDHPLPQALPFSAKILSVGHETANVGWAGVSIDETTDGQSIWRALVRNYSASTQEREWRAEAEGKVSSSTKLTLAPRETRTLTGPFPNGDKSQDLRLILSADALTLDDQLPILQPRPKLISLNIPPAKNDSTQALAELFQSFADTTLEGQASKADVRIISWPPSIALEDNQHACVFASPAKTPGVPPLRGTLVAEAHPLMEGLNWQSLLVREGMVVPQTKRDRVLLWQAERPLISLRLTASGAQQLFCHFDLATSNARKLPAMAVLVHRFLQGVRSEKVSAESANFDVRQKLTVAHFRGEKAQPLVFKTERASAQTIPLHQVHLLRAPDTAEFFQITQGDQTLLKGAAHFADNREADLSAAKPYDERPDLDVSQVQVLRDNDPNWQFWILALLAILVASWWWGRDKTVTLPPRTKAA